jgi:UrcA family protein
MTMLATHMRQSVLAACTLLLAATATIAADAPIAGHVTVQAERPTAKTVGRTPSGAPIGFVELRGRVSYSDLDLSIPSNAKVLKQRVHDAAQGLCANLDQLYPITVGTNDCTRKAEGGAMPQVDAVIAAAQARKSSAK